MSDEPLPIELRLGLRPGSVFYFQSRELTSEQPHFFVVVNRDPIETKRVLLTIVTSKSKRFAEEIATALKPSSKSHPRITTN